MGKSKRRIKRRKNLFLLVQKTKSIHTLKNIQIINSFIILQTIYYEKTTNNISRVPHD